MTSWSDFMTPRSMVVLYLAVPAIAAVASYLSAGGLFALNLLAAYLSSVMIMTASYFGYRQNLSDKSESAEPVQEWERDIVDDIGNPHGILDEEVAVCALPQQEEARKESKPRTFTWGNLMLGSKIFFSLYRIVAYMVLVGVVMALIRQEAFLPWGFMLGILVALVPLLVILLGLKRSFPG